MKAIERAEIEKIVAEIEKIKSDSKKVNTETFWYPIVVMGGFLGATAAITAAATAAFVKLI